MSSSQFTVSNGQIINPQGQAFRANGIAVYDSDVTGDPNLASEIQNLFPGVNLIRVANYSYDSASSMSSFVSQMTSKGIAVEFEDHDTNNSVLTGSALATESNWYASLASAFKNNPYVWFGTMNEPGMGDSDQQLATYNAIRGTGNNNPLLLEAGQGGGSPNPTAGLDASDFAGMHNVIWDLHYYDWMSHYSSNQTTVNNVLSSMISSIQTIHSADGIIPVIDGEYGNATDGQNIDPGGAAVVNAVNTSTQNSGGIAWIWTQPTGSIASQGIDSLTYHGQLTSFGRQVAAFIGTVPPVSPPSPPVSPPPPPVANPIQPTGQVVLTPSSGGSFTDRSGNVWTLSSTGRAIENGSGVPGGGGTSELAYVASTGTVYGQDAASGNWYTFDGSDWNPSSTNPISPSNPISPPPPPVATPTPPTGQVLLTRTSGGSFTDRSGNVWTLTSSGRAMENGSGVPGGGGTSELAYVASTGTVYGQDAASGNWYTYSGSNWHPSSTSPLSASTVAAATTLQSGPAVLTPASGGSINDGSGNVWTLSAAGNAMENGSAVPGGGGTSEIAYVASTGLVWGQDAASGSWFTFDGSSWNPDSTSPISAPTPASASTPMATSTSASSQVALTATSSPVSAAALIAPAQASASQMASLADPLAAATSSSGAGSLASSLPDVNTLLSHPDFTQTPTTLGETGNSQGGSTQATGAAASAGAKSFALFNQMMAESFGNEPNLGQIATASSGSSQPQSTQFLAKALG